MQDKVFNRLLAAQKERRLEGGGNLSGNIQPLPVGGTGRGGVRGGRRMLRGIDLVALQEGAYNKNVGKGGKVTTTAAKDLSKSGKIKSSMV